MRQKFRRNELVTVKRKHGEDFKAIIDGSYAQLCGGLEARNFDSYQVWVIKESKPKEGKVVNTLAWISEEELTPLLSHWHWDADEMIDDYLGQKVTE